MNNNKKIQIILASSSPRRKKILSEMGYEFITVSPAVEEKFYESAEKTVIENAHLKALHVAQEYRDCLIIAADTVVAFEDRVLGKPNDLAEAQRMLETLSDREHKVLTAVTIIYRDKTASFCDASKVKFKKLNEKLIKEYFFLCNPLDKAGAYNIDEHGELLIEKIEGSYSCIMGLPKEILSQFLKKFDFF